MKAQWLLASDIDNTLTGNPTALQNLGQQLRRLREKNDLFLVLSTGRRLVEVLDGFEEEDIPQPDAIIGQVGTEIYVPPFSPDMPPMAEWDSLLREQYSREEALQLLDGIENAEIQAAHYNTPLKVSYFLDKNPDPDKAAELIKQRAAEKGDRYQVVWSSGRDLDILPAASGKGKAIRFLIDSLNLSPETVIVAGDSGNDRTMFEEFGQGVIVGNAKPELKQLKEETNSHTNYYFAEKFYAAGVEEGLQHFGKL